MYLRSECYLKKAVMQRALYLIKCNHIVIHLSKDTGIARRLQQKNSLKMDGIAKKKNFFDSLILSLYKSELILFRFKTGDIAVREPSVKMYRILGRKSVDIIKVFNLHMPSSTRIIFHKG